MSKILAGIAALTLAGAALMPIQASATERAAGASTATTEQATEFSAQRRHWRHRHGWRHHRHWGPRYGYYRPYRYYGYPGPYYYGAPYGYYRPGIAFGFGPFGFRAF